MAANDATQKLLSSLEGLPPRELVVIALRASWRALPVSVDMPAEDRLGILRSLAAASTLFLDPALKNEAVLSDALLPLRSSFSLLEGHPGWDPAWESLHTAVEFVSNAVIALVTAQDDTTEPPLVRKKFSSPVMSEAGDPAEATHAYNAIGNAHEASLRVQAESAACVLADAGACRERPPQEYEEADGGQAILFRPLWARRDAREPPGEWQSLIDDWAGQLQTDGLGAIVDQHARLLKGERLDSRALLEFAAHAGLAEQAARTGEDEAGEGESGTGKSRQLLPAGIVTAASDTPSAEDALHRGELVETLARMLAYPRQELPMTIALLGDWGSGKSSVIEQLKKRLDELAALGAEEGDAGGKETRSTGGWLARLRHCWHDLRGKGKTKNTRGDGEHCQYLFAEFNAWRYEQTQSLHAGLAQEVVRGLTRGLSPCARLRLAWNNAASRYGMDFHLAWVAALLSALALAASAGLVFSSGVDASGNALEAIAGAGWLGALMLAMVKFGQKAVRLLEHPLASKLNTYLHLPDYGEYLGELPVIREDIASLCDARLSELPNGRLLVIIDDLDRCQPEKISEVFDAIRLVMELKNVAVIVAIDDRIAFRAVARHYRGMARTGSRKAEQIARDYLSKIIQLPVNLPSPDANDIGNFIHRRLFPVAADTPDETKAPTGPQGVAGGEGVDGVTEADLPDSDAVTRQDQAGGNDSRAEGEETKTAATGDGGADGEEPARDMAEPQQQGEEVWRQVMRDTRDEQTLFADLARELGFNNPRQLIRLRNAYRLLKGHHARSHQGVAGDEVERLMTGLFWYEFLYQHEREDRQRAEAVAWLWPENKAWEEAYQGRSDAAGNPPIVHISQRLGKLFPRQQEDWEEQYARLMARVGMTILPHAELGVSLRAEHFEHGLNSQDLDPWHPRWIRGKYGRIAGDFDSA